MMVRREKAEHGANEATSRTTDLDIGMGQGGEGQPAERGGQSPNVAVYEGSASGEGDFIR